MRLSAPTKNVFWISVVLFVVGFLANVFTIPVVTAAIGFWLIVVAYVLLFAGNYFKGF